MVSEALADGKRCGAGVSPVILGQQKTAARDVSGAIPEAIFERDTQPDDMIWWRPTGWPGKCDQTDINPIPCDWTGATGRLL